MTINGKDVKLSEFEYLYNKNNQQQVEKNRLTSMWTASSFTSRRWQMPRPMA